MGSSYSNMIEIVRWSTFTSTMLMAIFGYSDQLRLIFKSHSTDGLSFVMVLLALFSWTSYMLYGWLVKDKKMFWANLLGTVFILIILLAFIVF